jgi:cytochrome c peroxidase
MHTGQLRDLNAVLNHYNQGIVVNANLDNRLKPNGRNAQKLNLTPAEVNAVIAFLRTLSGTNVYVDSKWSNPFVIN